MPFVICNGIPEGTTLYTLGNLRQALVSAMAESMEVPLMWCRAFFPTDMVMDPITEADGAKTIYARLETGMFYNRLNNPLTEKSVLAQIEAEIQDILGKLTGIIWEAFDGECEVETKIVHLPAETKSLIDALGSTTSFPIDGQLLKVKFNKIDNLVAPGVKAFDYFFIGDDDEIDPIKDLALFRVNAGCSTPPQKVLKGTHTIEGYMRGRGKLTIHRVNCTPDTPEVHEMDGSDFHIEVFIGDIMQWTADPDAALYGYEICEPHYADGRYENLPD